MNPPRWVFPALAAACTFAAFLPVLGCGFVDWDDDTNFLENPHYRGLAPSHLRWMFTTFLMGHYQPLAWMTLGADYVIWGMNPGGYHFTSLLIHSANAALVFLLILALLKRIGAEALRPWVALAGALFYSIHPLRVESVAWITERRDVLCGFFLLLSTLAYLRMVREREGGGRWTRWLAASCALFGASLLSKALGILLPCVLLILDMFPLGRWRPGNRRAVLMEKAPFLLLAAADGLLMLVAMSRIDAVRSLEGYAAAERTLQATYGIWFYAWKTLFPLGLSPVYAMSPEGLWTPGYLGPFAVVAALTLVLMALRRRWPAGLAAWCAYGVLLLPVLGFVVTGYQRAADRYTYLSALPLAVLAAAGFARLAEHSGRLAAAGGGTVLLVLGGLTTVQCGIWKDSSTLWNHAVAVGEGGSFAWYSRGASRLEAGDAAGAIADFGEALRIEPGHTGALSNRGVARSLLRDFDGAIDDQSELLRLEPGNEKARINLGLAKARKGDLEGAVLEYDLALSSDPKRFEGWYNRGRAKMAQGLKREALADFERALSLDPGQTVVLEARGRARFELGIWAGAEADLAEVLRRNGPDWPRRTEVTALMEKARRGGR